MAGESRGGGARGQTARAVVLAAAVAAAMSASGCVLRRESPAPVITEPASVAEALAYVQAAAESDLFEITTSQLALRRTQNPDVRAYATGLIEHHTLTSNALLAAARAAGLAPPPPVLSGAKLAQVQALEAQVGFAFDRAYVNNQVPSHRAALDLHGAYARAGGDPRLRQTATAAIPVVESHLREARRLYDRQVLGL